MVIDIDCTGSCKSNYHKTTTAPFMFIDFLQILGQIMTGTEIITSVVVDTICIPSCPCDAWFCTGMAVISSAKYTSCSFLELIVIWELAGVVCNLLLLSKASSSTYRSKLNQYTDI